MGSIAAKSAALRARPDLDAAIVAAFDAVVSPELWPSATEGLARAAGGVAACFHQFGGLRSRFHAPMSGRYRDMLTEFIGDGWGGQDLRAKRGWPRMVAGLDVVLEDDMTTPEERGRLPIYNDLFRRHEVELLAGVALRRGGQLWSLNVLRPAAMGPYEAETVARMRLSQPYLTRLLTFAETLAVGASRGALGALEHAATAAILLDGSGQVAELNAPARALLGRGLAVRNRRLCTDDPAAQAALDALAAAATGGEVSRAGVGETAICIPREGRPALLVDAVPIRERMADAFGRAGAVLVVTDLERRAGPPAALLRRLYGLTAREAELAVLVGAGHDVAEIAQRLGLQASSVRQLVKVVLSKTGAGRQAELASLVSRLPAGA